MPLKISILAVVNTNFKIIFEPKRVKTGSIKLHQYIWNDYLDSLQFGKIRRAQLKKQLKRRDSFELRESLSSKKITKFPLKTTISIKIRLE